MAKRKRTKKVEVCEACGGRGWLLMFHTDRQVFEIERCDACEQFESDKAAGECAAPVIDHALTLLDGIRFQETRAVAGQAAEGGEQRRRVGRPHGNRKGDATWQRSRA